MTREIKFRAWDTKEKEITNRSFEICNKGDVQWNYFTEAPELILMQFTGLLDKNRKEIYEGDVVRFIACNCMSNNECKNIECPKGMEVTDVVEFDHGCFFFMNYEPSKRGGYASKNNKICEIIGNIYENPELLKI